MHREDDRAEYDGPRHAQYAKARPPCWRMFKQVELGHEVYRLAQAHPAPGTPPELQAILRRLVELGTEAYTLAEGLLGTEAVEDADDEAEPG